MGMLNVTIAKATNRIWLNCSALGQKSSLLAKKELRGERVEPQKRRLATRERVKCLLYSPPRTNENATVLLHSRNS